MKSFIKISALLPIVLGIAFAALLIAAGQAEDAPGLGGIGLIAGFLLAVWGVRNTGVVIKGVLLPFILLCFGAGGILLSVILQLDGELKEWPWFAPVVIVMGVIFIIIGAVRLRAHHGTAK